MNKLDFLFKDGKVLLAKELNKLVTKINDVISNNQKTEQVTAAALNDLYNRTKEWVGSEEEYLELLQNDPNAPYSDITYYIVTKTGNGGEIRVKFTLSEELLNLELAYLESITSSNPQTMELYRDIVTKNRVVLFTPRDYTKTPGCLQKALEDIKMNDGSFLNSFIDFESIVDKLAPDFDDSNSSGEEFTALLDFGKIWDETWEHYNDSDVKLYREFYSIQPLKDYFSSIEINGLAIDLEEYNSPKFKLTNTVSGGNLVSIDYDSNILTFSDSSDELPIYGAHYVYEIPNNEPGEYEIVYKLKKNDILKTCVDGWSYSGFVSSYYIGPMIIEEFFGIDTSDYGTTIRNISSTGSEERYEDIKTYFPNNEIIVSDDVKTLGLCPFIINLCNKVTIGLNYDNSVLPEISEVFDYYKSIDFKNIIIEYMEESGNYYDEQEIIMSLASVLMMNSIFLTRLYGSFSLYSMILNEIELDCSKSPEFNWKELQDSSYIDSIVELLIPYLDSMSDDEMSIREMIILSINSVMIQEDLYMFPGGFFPGNKEYIISSGKEDIFTNILTPNSISDNLSEILMEMYTILIGNNNMSDEGDGYVACGNLGDGEWTNKTE